MEQIPTAKNDLEKTKFINEAIAEELPVEIVEAEHAIKKAEKVVSMLQELDLPDDEKAIIINSVAGSVETNYKLVSLWWKKESESQKDALTGLPTVGDFNKYSTFEVHVNERHPERIAYSLIDIDKFKQINDTFGHLAGDRYLQLIAENLQGSLRGSDFLARIGGDEFAAILMLEGDAKVGMEKVGKKMFEAVKKAKLELKNELKNDERFADVRKSVSEKGSDIETAIGTWGKYASIGLSHGEKGDTVESMKGRADQGTYAGKEADSEHSTVYIRKGDESIEVKTA